MLYIRKNENSPTLLIYKDITQGDQAMKQGNNRIKKIKSILPALGITVIIAIIVFAYVYVICSSDIPTWAKWLILTR